MARTRFALLPKAALLERAASLTCCRFRKPMLTRSQPNTPASSVATEVAASWKRSWCSPVATHGSVDHGEEGAVRNDLGWPGCDRLAAARGQRGEHDKPFLDTVRQRCDGVEPSGCDHGVIIGRRTTREDFRGNTMGSLLP